MKRVVKIILSIIGILVAIPLLIRFPIRQDTVISHSNDLHILTLDKGALLVSIGPSNIPNTHEIDCQKSILIGPDNTPYHIETEKHQFDIDSGFPYIRDRVYRIDENGVRLSSWPRGTWKLILHTKDNGFVEIPRHAEFKVWTFFYNPIFHGLPI